MINSKKRQMVCTIIISIVFNSLVYAQSPRAPTGLQVGIEPVPSPEAPLFHHYVAETQTGSGNGSNCSNARGVNWVNTPASWGIGDEQIGAGEVVHLCGTISTQIRVRGNGTAGSPITILFEPNAKMSAPFWPAPAALYVSEQNHIVIDGGINNLGQPNGIISATASGTNFGNPPVTQRGLRVESSNYIEIKNLHIKDLYVRTPLSSDSADQGFGMSIAGTNHVSVHHTKISDMRTAIVAGGPAEDIAIYSNHLSRISNGLFSSAGGSATSVLKNLKIYNNTITDQFVWDGTWAPPPGDGHHHNDGLQISAPTPGSYVDGVEVYGNIIGGDMGVHITSFIYMEDDIRNVKIHSNLLYATGSSWPVNGFIVAGTPALVCNNTIVAAAGGTGISARGAGSKVIGNIMYNIAYGIGTDNDNRLGVSDYNLYYFRKDREMGLRPYIYKYDKWRADLGYDAHSVEIIAAQADSVFIDPVNGDFRLKAGSPVIDKITDSSIINTLKSCSLRDSNNNPVDVGGKLRPQGAGWDIGAFEY